MQELGPISILHLLEFQNPLLLLGREIINHENCINELRFTNYYLVRIIAFALPLLFLI